MESLIEYFELEGYDEESVKKLINDFKKQAKKFAKEADSEDAKATEDSGTCEWVVRSKDKPPRKCGENAKREIDGHWFCGTENSGHYKASAAKSQNTPKSKKTPIKEINSADNVISKLTKNVMLVKQQAITLKNIEGTNWWAEEVSGLLCEKDEEDPSSAIVIGMLDDNGEEPICVPLTQEGLKFAKTHNLKISPEAKILKFKKVAKKEMIVEEQEEQELPPPRPKTKKVVKKKVESEEEEEEPPKPKTKKVVKKKVESEEEEEEEEEPPKPKTKKVAKKKVESEEEEEEEPPKPKTKKVEEGDVEIIDVPSNVKQKKKAKEQVYDVEDPDEGLAADSEEEED
jgi:hypothetical protein